MANGEAARPGGAPPPWSRPKRDLAAVLWASFLAACAGSVLFFGIIDPLDLAGITTPSWDISRMTGYAIGFFFLWLVAGLSALLARFLLRRPPP
jgi:hypothetical protein